MSGLSEFESSTILAVRVAYSLIGPKLIPCEITSRVGITPDFTIEAGAPWLNPLGQQIGVHDTGLWGISSARRVQSKDINHHLQYLVERLLPRKRTFCELTGDNSAYFDILWKSSYLNAGAGLRLEPEWVSGIAALNASMRFDIYQQYENPALDPHRTTWWA